MRRTNAEYAAQTWCRAVDCDEMVYQSRRCQKHYQLIQNRKFAEEERVASIGSQEPYKPNARERQYITNPERRERNVKEFRDRLARERERAGSSQ